MFGKITDFNKKGALMKGTATIQVKEGKGDYGASYYLKSFYDDTPVIPTALPVVDETAAHDNLLQSSESETEVVVTKKAKTRRK